MAGRGGLQLVGCLSVVFLLLFPTVRNNFIVATGGVGELVAVTWHLGQKPESFQAPFYAQEFPDLYETSIAELQDGLAKGLFSSVDLVQAYFARIEEVNHRGPKLNAVIELNPSALAQAAALDGERFVRGPRGPLHGIPILLKDNIATLHSEGMNTTAGSYALLKSVVPRDAFVAAQLRAAGAIFLGKAAMSEWSNSRGIVPSGFSGRGGQATSPYYPLLDPSGSSSGSGISASIGLAAATLGTETDGSIISPSERNNLVGIKPTVGLTSRAGVIPISEHQDTVGPICRSIADAATILSVIAGRDLSDNYTFAQPESVPDFTKALNLHALKGARLGVPRHFQSWDIHSVDPNIVAAFNRSIEIIRSLGATVIDPAEFPNEEEIRASNSENIVLSFDLKLGINRYLSDLVDVPTGVRNLTNVIAYNKAHPELELIPPFYADQSRLIESDEMTINETYYIAVAENKAIGGERGIDATLKQFDLDAILLPTSGYTSRPAAIAGYPVITVPLGFQPDDIDPSPAEPIISYAPGMPFGISFIGTAFSEFSLIGYAYAYEQATLTRLKRRAYEAAVPQTQLKDILAKGC